MKQTWTDNDKLDKRKVFYNNDAPAGRGLSTVILTDVCNVGTKTQVGYRYLTQVLH